MIELIRKSIKTGSFSLAIIFTLLSFSQEYGHEWIDFSKEYFKITDARTGIFKLSYDELQGVGFPVNEDPNTFQMFRKGKEIAIRVVGEEDGSFDENDYIIYYGKKQDGEIDRELYTSPEKITNPYVNLYSDTAAYFLTYNSVSPKRIEQNQYEVSVKQDYLEKKEVFSYLEDYSSGKDIASQIYSSGFEEGEGWMQWRKRKGGQLIFGNPDLTTLKHVVGYQPTMEIRLAGRNKLTHDVSVEIGEENTKSHQFGKFEGYEVLTETIDWEYDQVVDGELLTYSTVNGVGADPDMVSLVYTVFNYAITTDVQNSTPFYFNSLESLDNSVNVTLNNVPLGSRLFDVSDEYGIKEMYGASNNFILNNLIGGNKDYVLLNEQDYLSPGKISKVYFESHESLSSPNYLIVYHENFKEQAEGFRDYRSSIAGGAYNVLIVDQAMLFDQYSAGDRTPLSIKRFCNYMLDNYSSTHLMLLGNGTAINANNNVVFYRTVPNYDEPNKDFVMTIGSPSSDIMFTNKRDGVSLAPELATGRIPCYTSLEAQAYLDKIIEHESVEIDDLWRKRILHLSGGTDEHEAELFLDLLDNLKPKAEAPYYGAIVETESKKTDEAVEFINLSESVNEGIGLVTFLGHSSPHLSEIDIGLVSDELNGYSNKGKYPLLWMNGCQSTDVYYSYIDVRTRDWMFTADKGAIGAFGHGGYGYTFTFDSYTKIFYETAFQDTTYSYKSLGEIQQKVIKEFTLGKEDNPYYATHGVQFNYLGDPALKYFAPKDPDYAISSHSVEIEPFVEWDKITAATDSFRVEIIVDNYGRAIDDSLSVCVERTFGAETVVYEPIMYSPVYHKDTLYFTIINDHKEAVGLNTFKVKVDYLNELDEISEINNEVFVDYFVPLNGVSLIYPEEFSIVGSPNIDFVFQSNDLLPKDTFNYVFELSENISFEDLLYTKSVPGDVVASIKKFELPIKGDSAVYYWRVKIEGDSFEDTVWRQSSFTYVKGLSGWGQMEFTQFYKNDLLNVYKDDGNESWAFDSVSSQIVANAAGKNIVDWYEYGNIVVNSEVVVWGGGIENCAYDGVWLLVFDGETSLPYRPKDFDYAGMSWCGKRPKVAVSIDALNYASRQEAIIRYLEAVPNNDVVLVVSSGTHYITEWSNELKEAFGQFGAQKIGDVPSDDHPYLFLGKKGAETPLYELYGASDTSVINITYDLSGRSGIGKIASPIIGPVSEWGVYSHDIKWEDNDSTLISIYGVSLTGERVLLGTVDKNSNSNVSLVDDLLIDADQYPYLQLEAYMSDTLNNTASQLKKWAVTYTEVPEAVLNTSVVGINHYVVDTLHAGEKLAVTFAFQNISSVDFDQPVKVEFKINGEREAFEFSEELELLKSGDTLFYTTEIDTKAMAGQNILQAFFNPFDQIEKVYDNNILILPFEVIGDYTPPVTDVLFDDIHIMDGEVVSPNPKIKIYYHDNRESAYKSDTTGLLLFLKSPCENLDSCDFERVYFSDAEVLEWISQQDGQPFTIDYQPQNLIDGNYELMVQGQDEAGNVSSIRPYIVSFEVINENTISNFYPVPNPFSENCRFAFTLTGDVIPEQITIQIYSVEGELLREIDKGDLGNVHSGNNITDYAWDGTDEKGNLLSNGLYIYKVILDTGGVELKYVDSTDNKYDDGLGKIMIMR